MRINLFSITLFVLSVAPMCAADISGTITSTLTITENSKLVGDVTCSVAAGTPCIRFGIGYIELRLEGHILTGDLPGDSCPIPPPYGEDAIDTNGQPHVSIEGPGLVRRFRGGAITVTGNDSEVDGVTLVTICGNGIDLQGKQDSVSHSTIVRSSLSPYVGISGIFVRGTGGHRVRQNEVVASGDQGYGILVFPCVGPNNPILIADNNVSGNPNGGIELADKGPGSCNGGNIIRRNIAFGNAQNSPGNSQGDIGGNPFLDTFQDNACEVFSGVLTGGPCPNLPRIAGHQNPEVN